MLANLAIGTLLMIVNLGIQVLAIAALIRYFNRRINTGSMAPTFANDSITLSVVMAILVIGHVFMFSTWAMLFVSLGEFEDFATAFYHSTVNFTSLGYGDIVMSEERRLLGALEAANGVLMFGLTAGAILSVMNGLFHRRGSFSAIKEELGAND
jgi:voltage-gated potassium channel Kch